MNRKILLTTLIGVCSAPSTTRTPPPVDCQSLIAQFADTSDLPNLELALSAGKPGHLQRSYIIIGLMKALMEPKPFKWQTKRETLDHFKKILLEDQNFDAELFGNVIGRVITGSNCEILSHAQEFQAYPDFLKLFLQKFYSKTSIGPNKKCALARIRFLEGYKKIAIECFEIAKAYSNILGIKAYIELVRLAAILGLDYQEILSAISTPRNQNLKIDSLSKAGKLAYEINDREFGNRMLKELLNELRLQHCTFNYEFGPERDRLNLQINFLTYDHVDDPSNYIEEINESRHVNDRAFLIYITNILRKPDSDYSRQYLTEQHGRTIKLNIVALNPANMNNAHNYITLAELFYAAGQTSFAADALKIATAIDEDIIPTLFKIAESAYKMGIKSNEIYEEYIYLEHASRSYYDTRFEAIKTSIISDIEPLFCVLLNDKVNFFQLILEVRDYMDLEELGIVVLKIQDKETRNHFAQTFIDKYRALGTDISPLSQQVLDLIASYLQTIIPIETEEELADDWEALMEQEETEHQESYESLSNLLLYAEIAIKIRKPDMANNAFEAAIKTAKSASDYKSIRQEINTHKEKTNKIEMLERWLKKLTNVDSAIELHLASIDIAHTDMIQKSLNKGLDIAQTTSDCIKIFHPMKKAELTPDLLRSTLIKALELAKSTDDYLSIRTFASKNKDTDIEEDAREKSRTLFNDQWDNASNLSARIRVSKNAYMHGYDGDSIKSTLIEYLELAKQMHDPESEVEADIPLQNRMFNLLQTLSQNPAAIPQSEESYDLTIEPALNELLKRSSDDKETLNFIIETAQFFDLDDIAQSAQQKL